MKEKATIAAIVIVLSFSVGYIAVQTTIILRDMIFGSAANCEKAKESPKCTLQEQKRKMILGLR